MELKKFDYKLKESKKKPIIIALIIVIVLLIGITIYFTYAQYKVTNSYNILQGDVDFFEKRDITIAVKLVDEEGNITYSEEFPTEGYVFDSEKSYCINGAKITYSDGSATISEVDGKDKCTLYFKVGLSNVIQVHAKANNYLYTTTPDFSKATTDGEYGLYSAEDDYGTSYYFRGDVENNYVKFGTYAQDTTLTVYDYNNWSEKTEEVQAGTPMYWRIIRINSDGTIRMIYDGTAPVANGTSHTATIANTAYNIDYDETKYVGYTYDIDGTETDSTIKGVVDKWYADNLETTYGSYIADSIFCNDREITSYYDYDNVITTTTKPSGDYAANFAPYDRLEVNKAPKLSCTNKEDRYTMSESIGNGLLTKPVGLITADEAFFAGGTTASNNTYYLYSGEEFWTSQPYFFSTRHYARVWFVYEVGAAGSYDVSPNDPGTRPVINLKADVSFTGSGTTDNPYVITTN